MGYDRERRFEHHNPRIELPFQLVATVETGVKKRYDKDALFPNGLNRLFFSGRNYNIIFCDKNEVHSFTDIWEGGIAMDLRRFYPSDQSAPQSPARFEPLKIH